MLGVALLERCGADFDALDVAKLWLDYLPAGRIFTAERVAMRNLLVASSRPRRRRRNPFREWIGARLRVDAYGWAVRGDPCAQRGWRGRTRAQPHRERRLRGDGMAAVHAASLTEARRRHGRRRPLRRAPATAARRGGAHRAELAAQLDWEAVVDALQRYGELHWVHAINNTALVAAALSAFAATSDRDAIGGVSGGWDTDTNGAAVGSVSGALSGAAGLPPGWTGPLGGRCRRPSPASTVHLRRTDRPRPLAGET